MTSVDDLVFYINRAAYNPDLYDDGELEYHLPASVKLAQTTQHSVNGMLQHLTCPSRTYLEYRPGLDGPVLHIKIGH